VSKDSAKTYSILFAGVGGQGVLLAAEITATAAVRGGFEVKQTEVHGVSQRGGSVETHVRFGKQVWSPVVTPGKADVVVALEKLEALRFGHFTHPKDGLILANDFEIVPGSIKDAAQSYPYDALDIIKKRKYRLVPMPASQIARDLGDARMANVVLLGAMSNWLPISSNHWDKTLRQRIPERFREANLKAFAAGRNAAGDRKT
jgi:indolepyruvate ferredoxin oxidoreductase beta subunit